MNKTRIQQKGKDWRSLGENGDIKGIFRPKMGTMKDINGRDLVDTGEIKKRWKEYLEELYKKDWNERECCDDVFSHPEPDILESKVKWVLGSTAVNKVTGCYGIPVELFKDLKDDTIKCCIHYVSKSGRPSSGHRTGKGQSSSQSPRRVVLKNVLTIRQLHSSPMLIRSCLKSCMLGFSLRQTKNF